MEGVHNTPEPDETTDATEPLPSRRDVHARPRRRWKRWVALAVVVIVAGVGGTAAWATWRLDSNITKVDVSKAVGTDRPTHAPKARNAVNLLLVGSDNRVGDGNDTYGKVVADPGQHSDTNLLVHLSADRTWATVVSIPRDSMTKAPPNCSPTAPKSQWVTRQWNHNYKIGGIGCLIRTLEGNTGIFIDHYAVVDFRGFKGMVDALDGVKICTTEAVDDKNAHLKLTPGTHTLNGEQALAYVRARKSLGNGSDLGRIKRQQAFLSSIIQQATSSQMLSDPAALFSFLDAATKSLTTDPQFDLSTMKDLAESMRSIGLGKIEFMTVPNEVYQPDPNRVAWQKSANVIWAALREDRRVNEPRGTSTATPSATATPLTVAPGKITVQVLNGSGTSGLASQAKKALAVQGFTKVTTGNADAGAVGTLVEYSGSTAEAARTVAAAFPGASVVKATGLGSTVRVTLGAGSANVVEIPNRTGTAALPAQPLKAPKPPAQPTIETRTANQSICSS